MAKTATTLFGEKANYQLTDIDAVDIHDTGMQADQLMKFLQSNSVITREASGESYVATVEVQQKGELVESDQMVTGIEKFRTQRNTGKALQLLGVVAGIAVMGAASGGNDIPTAVYYVAAGFSGIGFIIDMDASRHLKTRR